MAWAEANDRSGGIHALKVGTHFVNFALPKFVNADKSIQEIKESSGKKKRNQRL